jgi:archaellum component FlaC
MFATDLLLAFAFMAMLFLRQIAILKQPNKINYAPLMIGIGTISSLVHFIINPESTDSLLLIRESIFPLLVALLLYIVMNILHQTQIAQTARTQEEFVKELVTEIIDLKKFILEIETKMITAQERDRNSQEEIRTKFKEDIKALDTIQLNQAKFIDKLDKMEDWSKEVTKGFEYFSEVQLPELDNVVHKHIEILRVAEQDHYNKLTSLLECAVKSREDMSEDIEDLKESIYSIKTVSKEIANSITKDTLQQLSGITKAFENQVIALKSHTEGVTISLQEGEKTLEAIKTQSEIIMKQMVLSSSKMKELQGQNSELTDIYSTLKEIIQDVEAVKSDYVKSQAQLSSISKELVDSKDEQILQIRQKIETLSKSVSKEISESLEKLHEHYHIAGGKITQSIQMLAKRAQMKSGYGEDS